MGSRKKQISQGTAEIPGLMDGLRPGGHAKLDMKKERQVDLGLFSGMSS